MRSFSGYVHIPGSALDGFGGASEYNASIFFWYFESRNDPKNAPLSLYLGGGPGTTSLMGATVENGPCNINRDSNSTTLNPWSWNNNVNMLYVDQPVQVGFSYDELVPSILNLLTGTITSSNGSEASNAISVTGILPSQNPASAVNTTMNAARVLWQFTQIWLQDFPEHKSSDDHLSIWANSVSTYTRLVPLSTNNYQYGGHWGPGTMSHFQSQNSKIENGSLNATHLHLDTLGLINGCIDSKIEAPFYPEFAVNNTYGLHAIPEATYLDARNNLTKEGGCYDLIEQCRDLATIYDPENIGTNTTVNDACATATLYCFQFVQGAYTAQSGVRPPLSSITFHNPLTYIQRNAFDISRSAHSIFPPDYIVGFMNQAWVQEHLGAPLNFSLSSNNIVNTFFGVTGDPFKVTIETLDSVVKAGVKVALVYGDRDYRCNCTHPPMNSR